MGHLLSLQNYKLLKTNANIYTFLTVAPRCRMRWFSRKYFASVMDIREFLAYNYVKDMADTISNALTRDISRRFAT